MDTEGVVDRLDGEFAIIELGDTFIDMPLRCMPNGTEEGDLILITVRRLDRIGRATAEPQKPEIIDL